MKFEFYITDVRSEDNNPEIEPFCEQTIKRLQRSDILVHNGVGDLVARQRIIAELQKNNIKLTSIIDPAAIVSLSASIGNGVFIGPAAVVNARAKIGDNAIINTRAVIEHDCTIGKNCHIAPGVVLGGSVNIEKNSFVGLGSVIRDRVNIGSDCVIGAGSVVVNDLPQRVLAMGCPAKIRDSKK